MAEKKCRRIKSGRIPFLPEASIWIQRAQEYLSLLRYHSGKILNRGNLKRSARRCNIEKTLLLSIDEVKARLLLCKEKWNHFRRHGQQCRRKHLHYILDAAKYQKDEDAEKKILDIIRREKERGFWRRINYTMGKHKQGLSVREVEIEDGSENGSISTHKTQGTKLSGMRYIENDTFLLKALRFVKVVSRETFDTWRRLTQQRKFLMEHMHFQTIWMKPQKKYVKRRR